ncbi:MAG: hypothetical protein HZC41_23295 [Chloroflexi bacterium]|nr:hypothetical protein [Chloroflexota bacterium]
MDEEGNVIAAPLPTPLPTLAPPIPTPDFPTPACTGIHTFIPTYLRYAWYEAAPEIFFIDSFGAVDIYSQTDSGSEFNGSTVWYHVRFTKASGEQIFGWVAKMKLDQNELNLHCQNVPIVILPTLTPVPSLTPSPTPTPPPDLSLIFPLPMVGLNGEPARLTDLGGGLEYSYKIPSRDMNPRFRNDAGHPLYSSLQSTIMVTDRDGGANPGVFVSIRIPMELGSVDI